MGNHSISLLLQVFVFFPNEEKVGVKTINTFEERMQQENVSRAVMVVQAQLTPFAKQSLAQLATAKLRIEQVCRAATFVQLVSTCLCTCKVDALCNCQNHISTAECGLLVV